MNQSFFLRLSFLLMLIAMTLFRLSPAQASDLDNVVMLKPAKPLPAFVLKTAEGKDFEQAQLQQHWSLLFFGFTRCQMVCPTTLMAVKQAYESLEKNKKLTPQVVFVSVDSQHDTPQKADSYAKSFNPHFIGLAGKEAQIRQLTQSLGVLYMKVKQGNTETIDHSANLFLINPQGEVAAIFSAPYEPKALAKGIAKGMSVQ